MKTSKGSLLIAYMAVIVWLSVALPSRLSGQTAAVKPSNGRGSSTEQWSLQVEQVDPGNVDLAYDFQVAIYENLVAELRKAEVFQQVIREGDRKAREVPDLLVLKTIVENYTPGSETQRAVTTVAGTTKLTVRSQILTPESKAVLERTVTGDVRFFGSNLRATQNLVRNIAKAIEQSSLAVSEESSAILSGITEF
jgi:hypothetical protein